MKQFIQSLKDYAAQAGGNYKTRHDRIVFAERFGKYLCRKNIQIRNLDHLKVRHLEWYIASRKEQGISPRTLQNEMAMLRGILYRADKEHMVKQLRLTNRKLNIHRASRVGTKEAITNQRYNQILSVALDKDKGFAIALHISRLMGLRSEEAVQCVQSLETWKKHLDEGKTQLPVIFGSKGGRPRMTTVLNPDAMKIAVNYALTITRRQNGRLIDKPNLKKAMTYWRNKCTSIELIGKNSHHSLRYAWAQEAFKYYINQGYSRKEALAMTAMDLGHGDGRGRYVERVYGLKSI